MPEFNVSFLYAVFITLAGTVAFVTLVTENHDTLSVLQRKPFNCIYCMSVWVGLLVCICTYCVVRTYDGWHVNWYRLAHAVFMWPVVHIIAYMLYKKAM